jgi:hypothetical protein
VTISITVNNVPPVLSFSSSSYGFTLYSAGTTGNGTNTGGPITACDVTPALPTGLSVSQTSCAISGSPETTLPTTTFTLTPQNSAGVGASVSLSLQVADIPPQIAYSSSTFAFDLQSVASTGIPSNSGGGITGCSVSPALPAGLSLNSSHCRISGTPTSVTAATSYAITPSNAIGNGSTVTLSLEIRNIAPSLTFSTSSFTFTKNSAISTITPSNSAGSATSCSSTPTLPSGLSLSGSCVISGTPSTVQAATNYQIVASNSIGSDSARTLTITVNDIAPSITFSQAPFAFRKGSSVGTISVSNTGGAIVSCSVTPALPAGLTLNTSSCSITGTPSAITTSANYTVSATNTGGTGTRVISIVVNDALPIITYAAAQYYAVSGEDFKTDLPMSTGGALTNCTVDSSLPAGLSISPTTCQITGTVTEPNAGAFNFNVTPSSSGGNGNPVPLCIAVEAGMFMGLCGGAMED